MIPVSVFVWLSRGSGEWCRSFGKSWDGTVGNHGTPLVKVDRHSLSPRFFTAFRRKNPRQIRNNLRTLGVSAWKPKKSGKSRDKFSPLVLPHYNPCPLLRSTICSVDWGSSLVFRGEINPELVLSAPQIPNKTVDFHEFPWHPFVIG